MDWTGIVIAFLGIAGTLITSLAGSRKTTALILYRLDEIEKKQDKHNAVIERVYHLEERVKVLEVKENE